MTPLGTSALLHKLNELYSSGAHIISFVYSLGGWESRLLQVDKSSGIYIYHQQAEESGGKKEEKAKMGNL